MGGVVAEHRRQQCAGRPADDSGGVERASRRVVEPAEVEAGELVDQRGNDRLVERQPGPRGQRGGGETQRERVAVGEPIHARQVGLGHAAASQQLLGLIAREAGQGNDGQQVAEGEGPSRGRLVTPGEHDADVVGEGGHEALAQPVVEQPQPLERVDDEHDALGDAREALGHVAERCHAVVVERGRERGEEAAFGGLDRACVELEHGRAPGARAAGEGPHQRGLPDARDAVHHGDERAAVVEQRQERGELLVAADEGAGPLVEDLLQRLGHDTSWMGHGKHRRASPLAQPLRPAGSRGPR